ncbi:hypothetical protein [Actinophytocola xanthii]|nr:hypothetical protein [Actinophytocola xanthii]
MFVLMAEAHELDNRELDERFGLRLDGAERVRLNQLGLVESTRGGGNRPFVHELTDRGWRWCADELRSARPVPRDSLGKAFHAVLAALGRYLERSQLALADVFHAHDGLTDHIRATYRALTEAPGDYVSLTDLRRRLDGTPRAEVDDAFRRLNRAPDVVLAPQEDQALLTERDRAAALRVGTQDVHLLAIEP